MAVDRREASLAALAVAVLAVSAGVGAAFGADDDGAPAKGTVATDAIVAALPAGHLALGVLDDDTRYEVNALDGQGDRYVVTIYRDFDEERLVDDPALPETTVEGDRVWTGFDDPDLQAVFVQRGGGLTVRVSHEAGGGLHPARPSIADLTAIARTLADHPAVIATAGVTVTPEPVTGPLADAVSAAVGGERAVTSAEAVDGGTDLAVEGGYGVTVYRTFTAGQLDGADLPRTEVDGGTAWTGTDSDDLTSVYFLADNGVGLRVGSSAGASVADLVAIAQRLATDPAVVAEAS